MLDRIPETGIPLLQGSTDACLESMFAPCRCCSHDSVRNLPPLPSLQDLQVCIRAHEQRLPELSQQPAPILSDAQPTVRVSH